MLCHQFPKMGREGYWKSEHYGDRTRGQGPQFGTGNSASPANAPGIESFHPKYLGPVTFQKVLSRNSKTGRGLKSGTTAVCRTCSFRRWHNKLTSHEYWWCGTTWSEKDLSIAWGLGARPDIPQDYELDLQLVGNIAASKGLDKSDSIQYSQWTLSFHRLWYDSTPPYQWKGPLPWVKSHHLESSPGWSKSGAKYDDDDYNQPSSSQGEEHGYGSHWHHSSTEEEE